MLNENVLYVIVREEKNGELMAVFPAELSSYVNYSMSGVAGVSVYSPTPQADDGWIYTEIGVSDDYYRAETKPVKADNPKLAGFKAWIEKYYSTDEISVEFRKRITSEMRDARTNELSRVYRSIRDAKKLDEKVEVHDAD